MTSPQQHSTPLTNTPTLSISTSGRLKSTLLNHGTHLPPPCRLYRRLSLHTFKQLSLDKWKPIHQTSPDPNEIPIPIRPFQNPPIYLSPTIEEIESLTLNSGPLQDMGDYLIDDIHAITLWEHLQQNLFNARHVTTGNFHFLYGLFSRLVHSFAVYSFHSRTLSHPQHCYAYPEHSRVPPFLIYGYTDSIAQHSAVTQVLYEYNSLTQSTRQYD
jgi:hypothetical protein